MVLVRALVDLQVLPTPEGREEGDPSASVAERHRGGPSTESRPHRSAGRSLVVCRDRAPRRRRRRRRGCQGRPDLSSKVREVVYRVSGHQEQGGERDRFRQGEQEDAGLTRVLLSLQPWQPRDQISDPSDGTGVPSRPTKSTRQSPSDRLFLQHNGRRGVQKTCIEDGYLEVEIEISCARLHLFF